MKNHWIWFFLLPSQQRCSSYFPVISTNHLKRFLASLSLGSSGSGVTEPILSVSIGCSSPSLELKSNSRLSTVAGLVACSTEKFFRTWRHSVAFCEIDVLSTSILIFLLGTNNYFHEYLETVGYPQQTATEGCLWASLQSCKLLTCIVPPWGFLLWTTSTRFVVGKSSRLSTSTLVSLNILKDVLVS